MRYNPFGGGMPVDTLDGLIGRNESGPGDKDKISILKHSVIDGSKHTVVMGVKGAGKTSLLKTFYNEYRKELVREKKLVHMAEFPTDAKGDGVYQCLCEWVKSAVLSLQYCGKSKEKEEILKALEEIEGVFQSAEARFTGMVETISQNYKYRIVLILDNFEQFTHSPHVMFEHHDVMNSLMKQTLYVVATDYDINKEMKVKDQDGQPRTSFFLQKFTNKICLEGLSEDDCGQLLRRNLKDNDIQFTEDQCGKLYRLSGGIPGLLDYAADCAYQRLEQTNEWDQKSISDDTYQKAAPLMEEWCWGLTLQQAKVLAGSEDGWIYHDWLEKQEALSAAKILKERGMLQQDRGDNDYYLSSGLLQRFREKDPERWQKVMEGVRERDGRMPLPPSPDNLPPPPPPDQTNEGLLGVMKTMAETLRELSRPSTVINIDKYHLDQRTIQNSVTMYCQQYFVGNLEWLGGRLGEAYAALLQERTAKHTEGIVDAEYTEISDAVANKMLPQGEHEERSLEERFQAVRYLHPELTDELLEQLSERCRKFLKVAFVTEDRLKKEDLTTWDDFSPQMIMYGKALERALKDAFFKFFHEYPPLSLWNTYKKNKSQYGELDEKMLKGKPNPSIFANYYEDRVTIGSFHHLIRCRKDCLAELCINDIHQEGCFKNDVWADWWNQLEEITEKSEPEDGSRDDGGDPSGAKAVMTTRDKWADWWHQMWKNIELGGKFRNGSAHSSESPGGSDLDNLCALLFGGFAPVGGEKLSAPRRFVNEKGILRCCAVGPTLYDRVVLKAKNNREEA